MRFPFARDASERKMERSKGARLKDGLKPNALRWRVGHLLGCAFAEAESSKILIGKLGPRGTPRANLQAGHARQGRDGGAESA
jgi:hypothetical protein